MNALEALGWSDFFEEQYEQLGRPDCTPARVALANRGHYQLLHAEGETRAILAGRLRHEARQRADLPAVGDWVAVTHKGDEAVVEHRFERRSQFTRGGVANESAQVIAANLDVVLIVTSFNADLNPRRLERYVSTVWNGGAEALIVVNKVDLVDDPRAWLAKLGPMAGSLAVYPISAADGRGVEALDVHLRMGRTGALVGSSGVGKSTLVNRLAGEERQAIRAIRDDDAKGRHTTTHRELVKLPNGALLVDTPGMRELAVVGDDEGVAQTFGDVERWASECRYRDCTHNDEPDCAVRGALSRGELERARFDSYNKLKRELAYSRRREDASLARVERLRWKKITKSYRKRVNKRS